MACSGQLEAGRSSFPAPPRNVSALSWPLGGVIAQSADQPVSPRATMEPVIAVVAKMPVAPCAAQQNMMLSPLLVPTMLSGEFVPKMFMSSPRNETRSKEKVNVTCRKRH